LPRIQTLKEQREALRQARARQAAEDLPDTEEKGAAKRSLEEEETGFKKETGLSHLVKFWHLDREDALSACYAQIDQFLTQVVEVKKISF